MGLVSQVWFNEDLIGTGYRRLIGAMRVLGARFGFVVPLPRRISKAMDVSFLVEPMMSDLISVDESYSWPGTRKGRRSRVYRFRLTARTEQKLTAVADALFDWGSADLPEDIFFERGDGTALLTTITHEKEGWLSLTKREAAVLRSAAVELSSWDPLARTN